MSNVVLSTKDLIIGQGDFKKSVHDLVVMKGELIHIKGPNGSGKSTLLKTISGRIHSKNGTIKTSSVITYIPQSSENEIVLPLTLGEWLDCFQAKIPSNILTADTLNKRWRDASGGERQKVSLLAKIQSVGSILLLDEPFNHVDENGKVETEKFISTLLAENFLCAVIIVSHQGLNKGREVNI